MISFLHTGEVHVATFDRLMDELAPGMPRRHRVEQGWLDEARDQGMSDRLRDTIRPAWQSLPAKVSACAHARALVARQKPLRLLMRPWCASTGP
jgi:hypothetical protein